MVCMYMYKMQIVHPTLLQLGDLWSREGMEDCRSTRHRTGSAMSGQTPCPPDWMRITSTASLEEWNSSHC